MRTVGWLTNLVSILEFFKTNWAHSSIYNFWYCIVCLGFGVVWLWHGPLILLFMFIYYCWNVQHNLVSSSLFGRFLLLVALDNFLKELKKKKKTIDRTMRHTMQLLTCIPVLLLTRTCNVSLIYILRSCLRVSDSTWTIVLSKWTTRRPPQKKTENQNMYIDKITNRSEFKVCWVSIRDTIEFQNVILVKEEHFLVDVSPFCDVSFICLMDACQRWCSLDSGFPSPKKNFFEACAILRRARI